MRKFIVPSLIFFLFFSLTLPLQAAEEERYVSLWGDITEIIFGLGYGDRVVAVDASSNYPEEVQSIPSIGFPGNLSAEAVLAYEPTKVIVNKEAGPPEVLDQIRAAGVDVIVIESGNTIDTPVDNIRTVAQLLGVEEEGERFVSEVQGKIDEAVNRGEQLETQPRALFILFSSPRFQFVAGPGSAAHTMIVSAGAINAGEEAGFIDMMPFSVEGLVAAQPDVIIATERGLSIVGGIEGVLDWPGVELTPAGQNENIVVFEDLYFMGMGPRTGDALLELVEVFERMQ